MKNAYEKLKGLKIIQGDVESLVVGFNCDKLICATEQKPHYSFRRLEKDSFIEEIYKDPKYVYHYCNESFVEQQNGGALSRYYGGEETT